MRFHSPDAASPFGRGGLNAYAYCMGDPVNRSDPSGEGVLDWIMVGVGIVASGIAAAMSGGALLPALAAAIKLSADLAQTTAVALLALDVTSIGLSIGSAKAMDDGNDALASNLGLGSMVLGLAGLAATGALKLGSSVGKAPLPGARRVSLAPVESPIALKAPPDVPVKMARLRGGADPTGMHRTAKLALNVPDDDAIRAMSGVERLNTAASNRILRVHMVSRGFVSPQLLNRFPQGIDLADQGSVINARYVLSMALIDQDAGGLNATMLARTGIGADALASLNPSLVPGAPVGQQNMQVRVAFKRPHEGVIDEGEHLYRMFLETGDPRYMQRYSHSLLHARTTNHWSRWNSPSDFVL